MIQTPRYAKFLPLIVWSGISLAIYQSSMIPLMTLGMDKTSQDEQAQLKKCNIAMIGLGLGEAVGGYFNGFLHDKYGSRKAVIFNLIELVIAVALLMLYTVNNEFSMWTASVMNLMWGLQDSGVNNFIMCIAGF
jgi:predicted MFS family arabinose efflux permease